MWSLFRLIGFNLLIAPFIPLLVQVNGIALKLPNHLSFLKFLHEKSSGLNPLASLLSYWIKNKDMQMDIRTVISDPES